MFQSIALCGLGYVMDMHVSSLFQPMALQSPENMIYVKI